MPQNPHNDRAKRPRTPTPRTQALLKLLSEQTNVMHQDKRAGSAKPEATTALTSAHFHGSLPPLALLLLVHFLERRPCRKLAEQEAFKGYSQREISKVLQALHRIGLLDQDGQTSGSHFLITPPGGLLLMQCSTQQRTLVIDKLLAQDLENRNTLPVLVRQLLQYFLEERPCWQMRKYSGFRRYNRREVSKALQALTIVGLVTKYSKTSGSKYKTTPAGKMLYQCYGET